MRTLAWLEAHSCLTLLGLTTWALVPQVGCLELPTMKQSDAERCAAGETDFCNEAACARFDGVNLPPGCVGSGDAGSIEDGSEVPSDAAPGDGLDHQDVTDAAADVDSEDVPDVRGETAKDEDSIDTDTDAGPDAVGSCTNDGACDDGDPCTADVCEPGGLCSHAPRAAGGTCDDDNPCTHDDQCDGTGACAGSPVDCDDGLPCSVDSCDGNTGQCLHDLSGCQCLTNLDCADDNPCTDDTCDESSGTCTNGVLLGTSCDDGDACTVADACTAEGACVGAAKPCDDGNPCTTDVCNGADGTCVHAPDTGAPCDDGDPCTVSDICGADGTCQGAAKDCGDDHDCSTDACNPTTGVCEHDVSGCECATNADCDDGEPCTDDICTSALSCVHAAHADGVACGPNPVSGACLSGQCRGVVDFDLGLSFGCAVLATGEVRCWGKNDHGQLGTGGTEEVFDNPTDVTSPVSLGTGDDGFAVKVATGWYHTCVIVKSGKVRCWGYGKNGRLGSGDELDRTVGPTDPATTIDFGGDGPALEIAAGTAHTCALLQGGKVGCWGEATAGKVGNGDPTDDVMDEPGEAPFIQSLGATRLAVGVGHTCVTVGDGAVRCWGGNASGQLGAGDSDNRMDAPDEQPASLSLGGVLGLAAGDNHACAIDSLGRARCWGSGANGALGSGGTANLMDEPGESPSLVGLTDPFVQLAAGSNTTCGVTDAGKVVCWGVCPLAGIDASTVGTPVGTTCGWMDG